MSMADLERAFKLVEKKFTKDEVLRSGPKSEALVAEAERILGVTLPHTYKVFLQRWGQGGIGGSFIYGLYDDDISKIHTSGFVYGVLQDRENFHYPPHIIGLYDVGEGSTYCLDLSQMNRFGECPVVVWPICGYDARPKLEIEAKDFGAFFLKMIKRRIEIKKEEEEDL